MDRRVVGLALVLSFLPAIVWSVRAPEASECGEPVPAPTYQGGERWTWQDDKGREGTSVVIRVEGEVTQIRLLNGDIASYDKDWIVRKIVRSKGEVVSGQGAGTYVRVGQKTLDFPLLVGKQWEISGISQPRAGTGSLDIYYERYKVLACEQVATPAGRFPALKVEVERGLSATQPRGGLPRSGTYFLWYAPQVKNHVKLHYVPSRFWSGGRFPNIELTKYEGQ